MNFIALLIPALSLVIRLGIIAHRYLYATKYIRIYELLTDLTVPKKKLSVKLPHLVSVTHFLYGFVALNFQSRDTNDIFYN